MPGNRLSADDSLLLVIDLQPSFLAGIWQCERVLTRSEFLVRSATVLGIPVIATEQVPQRMGGTHERIVPFIGNPFPKAEFSAAANQDALTAMRLSGRQNIIVVGIETHICVSQTCLDLMEDEATMVYVCPDAVSARSEDRHKLGMERIRDNGVEPIHTEALVYEWMGAATHPQFKEVLELVKRF